MKENEVQAELVPFSASIRNKISKAGLGGEVLTKRKGKDKLLLVYLDTLNTVQEKEPKILNKLVRRS